MNLAEYPPEPGASPDGGIKGKKNGVKQNDASNDWTQFMQGYAAHSSLVLSIPAKVGNIVDQVHPYILFELRTAQKECDLQDEA
jgi:hypothetical protein